MERFTGAARTHPLDGSGSEDRSPYRWPGGTYWPIELPEEEGGLGVWTRMPSHLELTAPSCTMSLRAASPSPSLGSHPEVGTIGPSLRLR